jgi:8-oxo-dGTP diphosphatase
MDEAELYGRLPRKRVGAGALITDAAGRVLMVEPTYKAAWEVPGGVVEADETAFDACRRECLEELGIEVGIERLLVIEHQCDGGHRGDSIMFIYDGGILNADAPVRRRHRSPPRATAALRAPSTSRGAGVRTRERHADDRSVTDRGDDEDA